MNIKGITSKGDLTIAIKKFCMSDAHFFKNTDGSTEVYNVVKCDHCKKECVAPNGVKVEKDTNQEWFGEIGLTEDQQMTEELSVTNDGESVCDDCYMKVIE